MERYSESKLLKLEKPLLTAIQKAAIKEGLSDTEFIRVACREKLKVDNAYKVMCEESEDMA